MNITRIYLFSTRVGLRKIVGFGDEFIMCALVEGVAGWIGNERLVSLLLADELPVWRSCPKNTNNSKSLMKDDKYCVCMIVKEFSIKKKWTRTQ